MAEVVLARILSEDHVRSRGFGSAGKPAVKKIREYAKQHGYDLSKHRSKSVEEGDLKWANWVIYMDNGNLRRLLEMKADLYSALGCLGHWVRLSRIPDPNFVRKGPETDAILDIVVEATRKLGKELLCQ